MSPNWLGIPGLIRENLYRTLSAGSNPKFATILKVIHARGLKLHRAATGRPTAVAMPEY